MDCWKAPRVRLSAILETGRKFILYGCEWVKEAEKEDRRGLRKRGKGEQGRGLERAEWRREGTDGRIGWSERDVWG